MPPATRMRRRISDTFACTSVSASANTATPRTSPSSISGSATSAWRPSRVGSVARAVSPVPSAASATDWTSSISTPPASESASTNSESSVPFTIPSTLTSALARVATRPTSRASCGCGASVPTSRRSGGE